MSSSKTFILFAALILGCPGVRHAAAATAPLPLDQARGLYKKGEFAQAQNLLETLGDAAGKPGEVTAEMARAEFAQGKVEAAVKEIKKAVAAAPDNARYRFLLGVMLGSYVDEVSIFSKLGVVHDMRDAFKQAIKLKPDYLDARLALMQFYLFAPGVAGGDEAKAKAQLAAIEKIDPAHGYEAAAAFDMKAKQVDKAIAAYRKALKLDPTLSDAALSLGFTLEQKKDWDGAFQAFRQVIANDDDDKAMAQYQLGKLAALSGLHAEAGKSALRDYLQTGHAHALPQPTYAHWRLGMIMAKAGDMPGAREEFQTALKLDPHNKDARESLAALDKKKG